MTFSKTQYTDQYMNNWSFDDEFKQNAIENLGFDGKSLQRLNANNLAVRVEYDVSNNPIYVGLASPGSLDSQERWQLRKLTFDGAGNCTSIEYASGSSSFNKIWDNRKDGTYTYS